MTLQEKALEMHREWNGKLETTAKAHVNSREDLSIAYTPGVAEPCRVIAKDYEQSFKLTRRSHLVAVITDGTAVLGLGDIGPAAGAGAYIHSPIGIVDQVGVGCGRVVMLPVRTHILIAQPGACCLPRFHGKSRQRQHPKHTKRTEQKRQQPFQTAAARFCFLHEKSSLS